MPYYIWQGINLEGKIKWGKIFARTLKDLDDILLNQDIGLIKARVPYFKINQIIQKKLVYGAINHLAILLNAQIPLHEALTIVSQTTPNRYFNIIILDIAQAIQEGISLSSALSWHDNIFDKLTISVVYTAERTGNLASSLTRLVEHQENISFFKNRTRNALLLPILTIVFFLFIIIAIFIFVIPKFETFFQSFKEPLPYFTQIILNFSQQIRSLNATYTISIFTIIIVALCQMPKNNNLKKFKDNLLFYSLRLNKYYKLLNKAYFLQNMAILLTAGIHILDALNITISIQKNYLIQNELKKIINQIECGQNLSEAIGSSSFFYSDELKAFITVGESSGDLSTSILQAGAMYQKEVYKIINRITSLIQPILLIILGLLIAGLIFSIYSPIFTLSNIIN